MGTLHVAWIITQPPAGNDPGAVINDIVSAETVTTSGASAKSGARPANATHALVTAIDTDEYVTNRGADSDAAAANSVPIMSGSWHVFRIEASEKVAAINQ